MRITEIETVGGEYGQITGISITVDTNEIRRTLSIREGEPEDMTFSRNLSSCHDISNLLKIAFEAGKAGESLEYTIETEEY